MIEKAALRLELKDRRSALSLSERREKGWAITASAEMLLAKRRSILAYAAKDPEVETLVLINRLLRAGKTVSVPIIEKETRTLRLSRLESVRDLMPGTFNVPEPLSRELPILPQDIETVLVPVVGFDRCGNRLGYGAGYYDRFLAEHPHLEKIGLAYACQEASAIPAEESDVRLTMVITESEIIRF